MIPDTEGDKQKNTKIRVYPPLKNIEFTTTGRIRKWIIDSDSVWKMQTFELSSVKKWGREVKTVRGNTLKKNQSRRAAHSVVQNQMYWSDPKMDDRFRIHMRNANFWAIYGRSSDLGRSIHQGRSKRGCTAWFVWSHQDVLAGSGNGPQIRIPRNKYHLLSWFRSVQPHGNTTNRWEIPSRPKGEYPHKTRSGSSHSPISGRSSLTILISYHHSEPVGTSRHHLTPMGIIWDAKSRVQVIGL